jgi:hypothetical protein
VGNLLFLSGIGPRKRDSKEISGVALDERGNIITYNIGRQCHSVFENVRLVLEAAGSSWDKMDDRRYGIPHQHESGLCYLQPHLRRVFSSPSTCPHRGHR